jgi:hypothetical protein
MTRWKNWYRMPESQNYDEADHRRISCTICGNVRIMEKGEKFTGHCASFASEEEAKEYAPRIYNYCQYLGAFPEGKRP